MNFRCRGDGRPGIRIITGTPRRVPEWSWWSADDFLGLRFSVENVAGMMILRAAMVGVRFCMDVFSCTDSLAPSSRWALRVFPAETRLTVYRRRLVSDLCIIFGVGFRYFSKLSNLFSPYIFFRPSYGRYGSNGISFIEFNGQDVENGRREVTRKDIWYEVYCL